MGIVPFSRLGRTNSRTAGGIIASVSFFSLACCGPIFPARDHRHTTTTAHQKPPEGCAAEGSERSLAGGCMSLKMVCFALHCCVVLAPHRSRCAWAGVSVGRRTFFWRLNQGAKLKKNPVFQLFVCYKMSVSGAAQPARQTN